jgi:pyruvate dehydrogenase E2 component (dihydrolipoamide acetyltransferase)
MVETKEEVAAFSNFKASEAPVSNKGKPADIANSVTGQVSQNTTVSSSTGNDRVVASPLAKKLATENNVELKGVSGTGPNDRIIKQDILDHLQVKSVTKETKPISQVTPSQSIQNQFADLDLSNMRKTIAERLLFSKTTIPHFYISVDIEVDNLLKSILFTID